MNNNNPLTIEEQALAMYKETVSPSKDTLAYILNQIPEIREIKERKLEDRRAIRSPYRWLATVQLASVFLVAFAVYPTLQTRDQTKELAINHFYTVDKQVEIFEQNLNAEDERMILANYTL